MTRKQELRTDFNPDFSTACIRGGVESDPVHGAVLPPIYQTTTFRAREEGQAQKYSSG